MIQSVIVIAVFVTAVFYVARLVYKSFLSKPGGECASGCGKCGAVDFSKLEQQLKEKGF